MKFTKLRLSAASWVDLNVVGASPADPYVLLAADGLGPPDVNVTITDKTTDGGLFQSKRTTAREIVLQIGLNPDYSSGQTASDLRKVLYGAISPVTAYDYTELQIINEDTVVAYIRGWVTKFETVPFSQDPVVQITIDSDNSYFEATAPNYITPTDLSFPTITNIGDAPTGFHLTATLSSAASFWLLTAYDYPIPRPYFKVNYAFLSGDTIDLDTNPGSRSITMTRSGTTKSLMAYLDSGSQWLALHAGDNVWSLTAHSAQVYYTPKYWGI